MIGIPTGPSLIIHSLVVFTSKFFPSILIKYKKISAGYFGFVFLILYFLCIGLFVMLIFYHLFTSQNNIGYAYKMIAGTQYAIVKPATVAQVTPDNQIDSYDQSVIATALVQEIPAQEIPIQEVPVAENQISLAGATSVSTGLTNNFLFDSFFLPLMILIAGTWLFKNRKRLIF